MIFALVGNQNCGKTTLFNRLTGANRHVGNFPGVTVDTKIGEIRGVKDVSVVDLPGIYSIRPYTNEEILTRDFILNERPDGIINIVDATNIERNLYLTLQLLEMKVPMVLALNMMDEVRKNGGTIDVNLLSDELGIPVIPISAAKNEGIDDCISQAIEVAKKKIEPARVDFCKSGAVHRCIHAVSHLIEDHAAKIGISSRFAATKVIEEDPHIIDRLELGKNEIEMLEHSIIEMETEEGLDRHEAMAAMRYEFIEAVASKTVVKPRESAERIRSVKIDNIVTNKYLALPIFFGIMLTVFAMTFALIGSFLSGLVELGVEKITELCEQLFAKLDVYPVFESLILDGIIGGVGSVISFVPQIVVLFFFLSILEDTGYMARIAFVMDKLLRKIGLSGRSFVPMLIGFGCTVPAVMSARTLSSKRDHRMTVLLTPFMSCSAKITIYAFFANALFDNPWVRFLLIASLYLGGALVGIIIALIMNKTAFRGKPIPFVMELPNYRLPSAKSVLLLMWEKAKHFIEKACTIIMIGSVIIWFLSNFTPTLYPIMENPALTSADSILGKLGSILAVLFAPLGFGDWRAVTALISGFTAKEAVVATLELLSPEGISAIFTTTAASISFLVFTLIYTPCVAAVAAIKNELKSGWVTLGVVFMQCSVAWIVSFIVYRAALLFPALKPVDYLIAALIIALISAALIVLKKKKKSGKPICCGGCIGGNCENCKEKMNV